MIRPRLFARPTRRLRPILDRLEGRALLATAGNIDPTFGTNGYYVSPPIHSAFTNGLTSVAVGPDGSIVAAGAVGTSLGVIRLTSAGKPDPAFGTNGEATIPVPAGTAYADLTVVAVTSSGRVVVGGAISPKPATGSSDQVIVARLNSNGTLDTTFGTGGEVLIGSSGLAVDGTTFTDAFSQNSLAVQPDGSVVLAGDVPAAGGSTTQAAVVRLNPQGAVDTTFGTGGLVQLPGKIRVANNVAITPSGQVLAAGANLIGLPPDYEADIDRLNADGSLSGSPIQTGYATFYQVLGQANGQILVLGETPGDPGLDLLERFNANGTLDASAKLPYGTQFVVQPDGGILVGNFRLTTALTPDQSFGNDGTVTFRSNPISSPLSIAAVAPDGSIIAVGGVGTLPFGSGTGPSYPNAVVARLTSTASRATHGDFTGDGVSDPAIFLTGTATFVTGNSAGGPGQVAQLGVGGAGQTIPAPGDYYGAGRQGIAAYVPSQGVYLIKDPSGQTAGQAIPIGVAGQGQAIPAPGDYLATGQDDVAVYLVQAGDWDVLPPGQTTPVTFHFGQPGAGNTVPVPGDYYGTGGDDFAVYLPRSGVWSILAPGNQSGFTVAFGIAGLGNSIPVPGDYDGSGKTELAVYLPGQGEIIYRSDISGHDVIISFGIKGAGQTLPEPGDYDGSGRTEAAAYLPALGVFAYRPALGGPDVSFKVGFAGQGPIIPVTRVAPSPLPGSASGPGSASAIGAAGVLGQADALDFLPEATAAATRKPKAGDPPA